ncbi:hypothetical protein LEP1GSC047_1247 [Leptospira inadai serovar Lyme str. 10]|uniref:Uncharacterized protein n=1 Tax=Leptospira inadai serovar Lyme str. 10 TaxID=1049790 RepID=V6H8W0_9LEPT|nr:hypothetical protein LEP1GSC047_1247 [Leptospira inadai serovar Lyme str. 10]
MTVRISTWTANKTFLFKPYQIERLLRWPNLAVLSSIISEFKRLLF